MAVATTAILATAAAVGAASSIAQGYGQKKQAEANAQIYDAQAKNIATAQGITAGQYRTKQNLLQGEAVTNAARGGIKISGSTANSISQSIMQLQLDNSYEQYNLQVQKQQALDNARMQRYAGRQAVMNGYLKAGQTALMAGANIAGMGGFGGGGTVTGLSPNLIGTTATASNGYMGPLPKIGGY